jgi:hypothetical protein
MSNEEERGKQVREFQSLRVKKRPTSSIEGSKRDSSLRAIRSE